MRFVEKKPARSFVVGKNNQITIHDCGEVYLKPDEQVTFMTEEGAQYDVARKSWGFYATPSLNGRLKNFKLKAVLVKNNDTKRYFVFLMEEGKEKEFFTYLEEENLKIVCWLDDDDVLFNIDKRSVSEK